MKTIDEFLKETVEPMDFVKELSRKNKFKMERSSLNEAPDDFAGDDGPSDFGGDDGPSDFGGDDFDGSDDDGDSDNETTNGDDESEAGKTEHEEDPDFTNVVNNPNSPVLGEPAAETIYDSDGVFRAIKGVIEALPEEQLIEIDGVKNCLELIFSGKKLNPEDLEFDNVQNAVFLFHKILEPLDDNTKNYAKLKLKTPIQLARDKEKIELATKRKDIEQKRDTILGIDKL